MTLNKESILNFNNITLVSIDGSGKDTDSIKALKYSSKDINFKSILYITSGDYELNFGDTIKIPPLSSETYQHFCLTKLVDYIKTDYIILIQSDGFIINPQKWTSKFLEYDYIGGPWPIELLIGSLKYIPIVQELENKTKIISNNKNGLVGNGGFTLRSKKLLQKTKELYKPEYFGIPEDNVISIIMRDELECSDIKIPYDIDFSSSFSCESKYINGKIYSTDDSFGFHGKLPHPERISLLDSIDIKEIIL